MNLTVLLLTAGFLNVYATGVSQQVSYSAKNVALKTIFTEVKKQTGFVFLYDEPVLTSSKPVTIDAKDLPLEIFLSKILVGQPLEYLIKSKSIFITAKPAGSSANKTSPLSGLLTDNFDILITVKGRIVNEKGEPVIASVVIKGTNRGTTSDANGYFELLNVDDKAVLVITATNIETITLHVKGKSDLSINAKTISTSLNAVVINKGYYSEKQRLSTGNISKISAKDIANQPVVNPLMALQGRVPGIDVAPVNGIPGAGLRIQIRGINSVRYDGGNPLYVIDGAVVDSKIIASASGVTNGAYDPLSTLNVENIESIEVLKDADATAIYGSRGANGVILITTKRGASGAVAADVNIYHGFGKVVGKVDMLSTPEYVAMRKEAFANSGDEMNDYNSYDITLWDTTSNIDFQKELLGGTANITDAQVNFSGGSQYINFRAGIGYRSEGTIFPGDFYYRKFNGQFNLNYRSPNNRLTVDFTSIFGRDMRKLHNSSNLMYTTLIMAPTAPKFLNDDGSLNWGSDPYGLFGNPLADLLKTNDSKMASLNITSLLRYKISQNFSFRTSLGYTTSNQDEFLTFPLKGVHPMWVSYVTGESIYGVDQRNSWIVEPQLDYKVQFGNHNIEMLAGSTFQQNYTQVTRINAYGFTSDALLTSLRSAPRSLILADDEVLYRYTALYGRIGYNYKEKYVINLTGRRDGSSRFGTANRFGNFGAIGTAWIISNEKFMSNHLPFISFAKIRASYGFTGNDQIGDYKFYNTYAATNFPYNNSANLSPTALFNPNYQWEKTQKIEYAIDLGFFQDRIKASLSYFRHRTSNQLVDYSLPLTTGFLSILQNMPATVQNSGLEIEFSTKNIQNTNFNWSTAFNISVPRNKLIKFDEIERSSYNYFMKLGEPIYMYRLFHMTGIDPATGLYTFEDYNKDGVINQDDQYIIQPWNGKTVYGGFSNDFQYKRFQLSVLIQVGKEAIAAQVNRPFGAMSNMHRDYYVNRWQKPGDQVTSTRLTTSYNDYTNFSNFLNSDEYWSPISFLRLKTISLNYILPQNLVNRLGLKEWKLFMHAQNIFTLSNNNKFIDPETGNNSIPPLRFFTFGTNVKF